MKHETCAPNRRLLIFDKWGMKQKWSGVQFPNAFGERGKKLSVLSLRKGTTGSAAGFNLIKQIEARVLTFNHL